MTIAQATEYAQKRQETLHQSSELELIKKSEVYGAPFKSYAKGICAYWITSRDELMAFLRAI